MNQNYQNRLHLSAGIILLAYAGSHFGFLFLSEATHHLRNIVFPFVSNWTLFLVAGLLETVIGVLCLKMRGRSVVNVAILVFVAIIVWYKWAFNYLGGAYCGCTGLLGRLLHLSKIEEKILPALTLVFLVSTTLPWLILIIKKSLKFNTQVMTFFFALLCYQNIIAEDMVQIEGAIDWQDHAPGNGSPSVQYQGHHRFVATIARDAWTISVTNIDRPEWWVTIVCDGTNTCIIHPESKYGFLAKGANQIPSNKIHLAMVDNSPGFPHALDEMNATISWFAYGLSPKTVRTNKMGFIDMPTPTTSARDNLKSYGYKWLIEFSKEGRFVNSCQIVRDRSLDLSDKEEMLRPELDYPETLQDYNEYLLDLNTRRLVPDGYVKCSYMTTAWIHTNGIEIPTASELDGYWWDPKNGAGPHPWHVITLKATAVTLVNKEKDLMPVIDKATEVQDYRYKKSTGERIFKYAEYRLSPGDSWKGDKDPVILAQAEDYLKHGRKFSTYANSEKHWVAWLLLATALTPAIFFAAVCLKKTQKQTK